MNIQDFLANATHIEGLYVSPDGARWSNDKFPGFTYKTREEILNPSVKGEEEAEEKQNKKSKKAK